MIWAFGCSHTKQSDWTKYLSRPSLNLAINGNSNEKILYQFLNEIGQSRVPSCVVIQWTHLTRFMIWDQPDKTFRSIIPANANFERLAQANLNIEEQTMRWFYQFSCLEYHAKQSNIRVIHYHAEQPILIKETLTNLLPKNSLRVIDQAEWVNDEMTVSSRQFYNHQHGLQDDETGHWTEESCRKFAGFVESKIF